jgi:hypothetical protein
MFKGLGISHISLPVRIFEPRSTIERLVDFFSFGPQYLKAASLLPDPLERFKLCISFAISPLYMCTSQLKPFNPLLGETMEGEFPDGTKIYCEHTSHHPPITNFLLEAPNDSVRIFGHSEFRAKMKGNKLNS